MVQVIQGNEDWANAGRGAGAGLAQGYMNAADEGAIRNAISSLGENASARDILNALTNTSTYGVEAKQNALKNYLGVEQFEELKRQHRASEEDRRIKKIQDREKTKNIVNQLNIPEEQKQILGESLDPNEAAGLLKDQFKEKADTPFQKKLSEKYAEEYINLSKDIPKLEGALDNINYARDLSKEIGITGSLASAVGLSSKGKELEGVSFPIIESIVKIFNPSGPIAQQKLKMITDKYSVSGTDAPWIRTAKLDALERFTKQALGRAKQRMELIEKYEGNPPKEVIDRFDKESDTMTNAILDYDLVGEEAKEKKLPNPKDFKDITIKSPDGKKYFSDGTRWLKK